MLGSFAAITGAFLLAGAANATSYLFTATGVLGSPYSVDKAFHQVPTPPSTVGQGDKFTISFEFVATGISPDFYYAADPTVNIYYSSLSNLSISVGSFTSQAYTGERNYGNFQLWNNHISSGRAVDYFGVSALRYLGANQSPIDLGAGSIATTFGFNAFDDTATARNSDNLAEEPDLSRYAAQNAYIGFINTGTYLQTTFSIQGLQASLVEVAPVPEPATWAMMVMGFGAVGGSMRRRATVKAVSFA